MPVPFLVHPPIAGNDSTIGWPASTLPAPLGAWPTAKPTSSGMKDVLLVGIVGRAGVGKTTVSEYLQAAHQFEAHALADPIKTMLHALFVDIGVDYAHLFDADKKHLPIPELGGITARRLMQTLGTDWGLDMISPDLWTRAADLVLGLPLAPVHDRIVISDVRFQREADWLRAHGGRLVRLTRQKAQHPGRHRSEAEADGIAVDAEIANDGPLEDLYGELEVLLAQWLPEPRES